MFPSKLIKLDDKSMVEIGENGILWKITSKRFHGIKNHRNWSWFLGEIEVRNREKFPNVEIAKLMKLKRNYTLNPNINLN